MLKLYSKFSNFIKLIIKILKANKLKKKKILK